MTRNHRFIGAVAGLVVLSTAGCTSGEADEEPKRLYDIPQALCDMPPLDLDLDPVFPPGESLEIDHNFVDAESGTFSCEHRVDRVPVIKLHAQFYTDRGVADPPYDYGLRSYPKQEPVAVPGSNEAWAWPGLASAITECTFEGETRPYFTSVITMYPDDEDLALELVSELIQPVAEHAQQYCNSVGSQATE
ncbi:hypothetical protein [Streptomyces spiramenti]|uniref:DUF3558 domain-containing protein n=1 Tax=Streptomyces spiramenti TaxID=2720606 RepID=A0ABX1AT04_9ACTN|nr:hypothetical protein [Streptomyces spiramenti]NJP67893.1 hypothetical protein [Streptomyces spiramenti]